MLANWLIALFLAYHVGMPLTYYLSARVYDERFSWRMFSTVRLQECDVEVVEREGQREQPVNLERDIQAAWVGVLKRLRPAVVEKYLRRRCERSHAREVTLRGHCVGTDGQALPERRFVLTCEGGELQQETAP